MSFFDDTESNIIPLITFDGSSYKAHSEAIEWLQTIHGELGVVACAGKYRTGKSFLQNCLCKANPGSGFGVGETVQACTKGIWLYKEVFKGDNCNVIFIDTEGIDALDADNTHDVRIFTLALLLSSIFLYNSMGAIDETALQTLSLVTNVTKCVKIEQSTNCNSSELSQYMPNFIWVLRDFSLRLESKSGNVISAEEYLENALQVCSSQKESTRVVIRESFPRRRLVTLPRPTSDENALQKLEMKRQKLSPKFTEEVNKLRTHILSTILPLKTDQHNLTGGMYAALCQTFANNIAGTSVPVIKDAWSLMEDIRHRDVKDALLQNVYADLTAGNTTVTDLLKRFDKECPGSTLKTQIEESLNQIMIQIEEEKKKEKEKQINEQMNKLWEDSKNRFETFNTNSIDLDDETVQKIISKQWFPQIIKSIKTTNEEFTSKLKIAESDSARMLREKAHVEETFGLEIERLKEEIKYLNNLCTTEKQEVPSLPVCEITSVPDVCLAEKTNELAVEMEIRTRIEKELETAINENNEQKKLYESLQSKHRELIDKFSDTEAQNETLLQHRMEVNIIRQELELSSKQAIENLKNIHKARIQEEVDKRVKLSADLEQVKCDASKYEEEIRMYKKDIEACKLEHRRSIEQSMAMHAALEDGQQRLLIAHKTTMEDSRRREGSHRETAERLMQTNLDLMMKKEEALRTSEIAKVEMAYLKRKLEENADQTKDYKRVKSELAMMNESFIKSQQEVEFLRQRKQEIVKEREEIRQLFMSSDRQLAVLKASQA